MTQKLNKQIQTEGFFGDLFGGSKESEKQQDPEIVWDNSIIRLDTLIGLVAILSDTNKQKNKMQPSEYARAEADKINSIVHQLAKARAGTKSVKKLFQTPIFQNNANIPNFDATASFFNQLDILIKFASLKHANKGDITALLEPLGRDGAVAKKEFAAAEKLYKRITIDDPKAKAFAKTEKERADSLNKDREMNRTAKAHDDNNALQNKNREWQSKQPSAREKTSSREDERNRNTYLHALEEKLVEGKKMTQKLNLKEMIKKVIKEELSRDERLEMVRDAAAKAAAKKDLEKSGLKTSKSLAPLKPEKNLDIEEILKSVKDASEDPRVKSLLNGPWKRVRPVLPEFAVWLKDHLLRKDDLDDLAKQDLMAVDEEHTADLLKAILSLKKFPAGFSLKDMADRYASTRKSEIQKLVNKISTIDPKGSEKKQDLEKKQKIGGYWKLSLGVNPSEAEMVAYAKWMFTKFVAPFKDMFPVEMQTDPKTYEDAAKFLTGAAKSEEIFAKTSDVDLKEISELWQMEDKNKFGRNLVLNQMASMDLEEIAKELGLGSATQVTNILNKAIDTIVKRGNILKMNEDDMEELNGMIVDARVAAAKTITKLIVQASKIETDASYKLLKRLTEMLGLQMEELRASEIKRYVSYVTGLQGSSLTPAMITANLLDKANKDAMATMQNMTAFNMDPAKSMLKGGAPPKDAAGNAKLIKNLIQNYMDNLKSDNDVKEV